MKLTPNEYRAILRSDFHGFIERSFYELNPTTPFLPNWHLEVIAAELEACRRGEIKRLIINVPPRSLKSLCASSPFLRGSWVTIRAPRSSAQAMDRNWPVSMRCDCRTSLASPWYQDLFLDSTFDADRQAVQEFMTTKKGFPFGYLRGRCADRQGCEFHHYRRPVET